MTQLERELTQLEFKFKESNKGTDKATKLEYHTDNNSTDQELSATNMYELKRKKTPNFDKLVTENDYQLAPFSSYR